MTFLCPHPLKQWRQQLIPNSLDFPGGLLELGPWRLKSSGNIPQQTSQKSLAHLPPLRSRENMAQEGNLSKTFGIERQAGTLPGQGAWGWDTCIPALPLTSGSLYIGEVHCPHP